MIENGSLDEKRKWLFSFSRKETDFMTLTESRKKMQANEHIEHAVVRYEFQNKIHIRNPWEKLAAAIILQTLLDGVKNLDFGVMDETWYWTLAGSIGLDVPYSEIRDRMLIRKYVFNEQLPVGATSWLDDQRTRSKKSDPNMKNNSRRSDSDGSFTGVCSDWDSDFSIADLYDWFGDQ